MQERFVIAWPREDYQAILQERDLGEVFHLLGVDEESGEEEDIDENYGSEDDADDAL